MIEKIYQKAFLGGRYFTIALRRKKDDSVLDTGSFHADYVFPASHKKWCADPILVDAEGRTFLFYEAVVADKGRLEVVELFDDGEISDPTIILDGEHHYSYPFVFQLGESWYLIPESSEMKEVRLYKADSFPFKWKQQDVLLNGRAVDTTITEIDGSFFLLTFFLQSKTEKVIPKCYRLDCVSGFPELTEIPWTSYDSLHVRGAGKVFNYNGKMIRPYQISTENTYGDAVGFSEFTIDCGEIKEKQIYELRSGSITLPISRWFDGLHTYSSSQKYETIDIRCRDFDFFKIGKMILKRINMRG